MDNSFLSLLNNFGLYPGQMIYCGHSGFCNVSVRMLGFSVRQVIWLDSGGKLGVEAEVSVQFFSLRWTAGSLPRACVV